MLGLGKSLTAQAPTNPLLQDDDNIILIQQNSLRGIVAPLVGIELMIWEATDKYGLNYDLFKKTINCECNLKKNHNICFGDRGLAFGRCQFHKPTFKENCLGNYRSEKDQIECMAKMWSEGKQEEWSCYKKIMRTFGDKI